LKILYLYNNTTYAQPLLSCLELLEDRGITIVPIFAQSYQSNIRHLTDGFDLIIISQELMEEGILAAKLPIIIHERIDGCQLAASRKWIGHNSVRAIWKSYSYRDKSLHNKFRGRAFIGFLGSTAHRNSAGLKGLPKPELSHEELDKIQVFYGFGSYERLQKVEPCNLLYKHLERPITVNFMGTVSYNETEVQQHRLRAYEAVVDIPNSFARLEVCIPFPEYIEKLKKSVATTCPYGWGEATHRDYEAALCGSLIIRPSFYMIDSWPDFYIPEMTFVPCHADFSNLNSIVKGICSNYTCYQYVRENAQRRALLARSPQNIVDRFMFLLEKVK
jgi:hypothetical protein